MWYSVQPVGVNKIDRFMRLIAQRGELDVTNKNFTNHSVRKTTVRKLQKAGVSNDKIIAIKGHKNEQSIKYYADTDLDDQKSISRKLSRVPLAEMSPAPNCQSLTGLRRPITLVLALSSPVVLGINTTLVTYSILRSYSIIFKIARWMKLHAGRNSTLEEIARLHRT